MTRPENPEFPSKEPPAWTCIVTKEGITFDAPQSEGLRKGALVFTRTGDAYGFTFRAANGACSVINFDDRTAKLAIVALMYLVGEPIA